MLFEKSIEALAQMVNKAIKTLFQGEGKRFAVSLKNLRRDWPDNYPQNQICVALSLRLDLIGAQRRHYTIRFHPLQGGEPIS